MRIAALGLPAWLAVALLASADGEPAAASSENPALGSATSESPALGFFAGVAGRWQGTGEVRGMESQQTMTWEPVLDGRFMRLSFDNRMTAADGRVWHFQAQAFYRIEADGTIAGTWFDSRGVSFPVSGQFDDGATMTIRWGTDDTERGRSRYRISAAGLEVTDEVQTPEGGWRTFGRAQLARLP